jgi:hypothetical protein
MPMDVAMTKAMLVETDIFFLELASIVFNWRT